MEELISGFAGFFVTSLYWGLGGLVGGIVVMLVARQFGWLYRTTRFRKVLVGFFYLYVPVVLGLFCLYYGVLTQVRQAAINTVDHTIELLKQQSVNEYEEFVTNNMDTWQAAGLDMTETEIVDKYLDEKSTGNELGDKALRKGLIIITGYAIDEAEEQAADYLNTTDDNVHRMRMLEKGVAGNLLDDSVSPAREAMVGEIRLLMSPFFLQAWLFILIALTIPAFESFLARIVQRSQAEERLVGRN